MGKLIGGEVKRWNDVCLSLRVLHQLRVGVEVAQVVVVDVQKWFFLSIDLEGEMIVFKQLPLILSASITSVQRFLPHPDKCVCAQASMAVT